jgi:phage protein D
MTSLLPSVQVKVSGTPLDARLASRIVEVKVEDNLVHPDTFLIRIDDPELEAIDSNPLAIGADIEILFEEPGALGSRRAPVMKSLIKGQVTSLEPEFAEHGVVIAARGYDRSHGLNRSKKTKTYQDMTYGDIARQVISGGGFSAGTIDDAGGVHPFVQQNNETDWDFLWRLASRIDNEVVAEDRKIHFRKASASRPSAPELVYGENLHNFRPRVTGVQQIDSVEVRGWNPKTKQAIVGQATAGQVEGDLGVKIGVQHSNVRSSLAGGKVLVADLTPTSKAEADAIAKSVMAQHANAYVDATGVAVGDPDLRAGRKVRIKKVGSKFSGDYTLFSTVHRFNMGKGYMTSFVISGRSARGLLDVLTPAPPRDFGGNSIVIGRVTNNKDPDNLGRVRIKYPALGDETEGAWARIASPSSGKDRGLLMMPQVDEEVLIAFEHDDPRKPFVLGSVWNGKDTPGDLVQTDGSFVLQSDQKTNVKSKDQISVKSDKEMYVETKGELSQKSKDKITLAADSEINAKSKKIVINSDVDIELSANSKVTISAHGKLTIKGDAGVDVQGAGGISLQGAKISLSAAKISLGPG